MGAEPYWYFVKYDPDIDAALQQLRRQEFQAGRYNPVITFIDFPIGPTSPAPGAQHATIEEAMEDADADGTRSILDLNHVAAAPAYFAVAPLPVERIQALYETSQPTRVQVEDGLAFFEEIERGQGIYLVLYKEGRPDELLFAGYSFD